MNNVMFVYNKELALSAGQSGFITESGAYIITINEAKFTRGKEGAHFIEISGESDDGRKVNYLNVCCKKNDGTDNQYGINMINAIMGCAGVKQLTQVTKDANTCIAPELAGKIIGLVLQKTLRTKRTDGSDTFSFDIRIPFVAKTGQTLQEIEESKVAEAVNKIVSTLKDKDERNKSAQHNSYNNYQNQNNHQYEQYDDNFSPF
ncbi:MULTISPECIES: DUF669 domain-containing protein [unclassified Photorhabdus]|uniref:DUF669 domain-containing protein n=1 Tax=unclassified Photorhabdus TaxID=2620880 RepID=UPI000DCE4FAB|nr:MULTISPECIES: DUF669 domain-containing protein [unclassified Photorhabdus]RAW91943.1 DUF669 domain-containing protein [Photorhabdus sp. S10-54]RAW91970.1 DUF669 domain-containing protein [Photorhabdus sp. S9-53]RAW95555.1 DUF669 domain-containing protein [Photorhabdus sp. S8-52]